MLNSTTTESPLTWKALVGPELAKPYFRELSQFLNSQYAQRKRIFPSQENIYKALQTTPLDQVKVVILGQDPYHGAGQAHGLCFSVPAGVEPPPSLKNIYRELYNDLKISIPAHGNLAAWAEQGVLLLNSVLTVEEGKAASHQNKGWEIFTDKIIQTVDQHCKHVVFILWGSYAQRKAAFVNTQKHLVLKSVHPSPLSADKGFFGSKPFSKTNTWLMQQSIKPVNWSLN